MNDAAKEDSHTLAGASRRNVLLGGLIAAAAASRVDRRRAGGSAQSSFGKLTGEAPELAFISSNRSTGTAISLGRWQA